MATYFIGDVQGCYDELRTVLDKAQFDPDQDHLYLAGDLVARGPDSLSVLRFLKSLGQCAHPVLGNHDLHLLAVAAGIRPIKSKDRTEAILNAPDSNDLLQWLRQQPLLIHKANTVKQQGFVMTHAGIPPCWDLQTAIQCAQAVENELKGQHFVELLQQMYANTPDFWAENLQGIERLRYTINALTRMRYCARSGALDMDCKLPPTESNHESHIPWFDFPIRQSIPVPIVFGHWAALNGKLEKDLYGLDTGCVWGGHLTLLRWKDKTIFTSA